MITALFSAVGSLIYCLGFIVIFIIALIVRNSRRPNKKQIRALQVALPTNAERPTELNPVDLERLAVYVYQRLGYRNVKYTGLHSITDGGVDVWMLSRQGHVEIVQCKQWQAHVDKTEIIEFVKTIKQQHAEVGHYWAPLGFSKPARDYAEKNNVKMYTDYEIRKLLEQAVEVDKTIAARQSIPVPKKTIKRLKIAQVAIIFGMALVACALIYFLLGAIVTRGG